VHDHHWAEDAVADAVARMMENLHAENNIANAYAWMLTAVKNAALNRRRDEARFQELRRTRLPRLDAMERAVEEDGPVPEEQFAAISKLLGRLPEQQRRVLTRRLLMGHSHADIAMELGCPVATVRSAARRGMENIREIMLSEGISPLEEDTKR
jgi:RNA polymerase sigma-70 factor (ECF subfamily)